MCCDSWSFFKNLEKIWDHFSIKRKQVSRNQKFIFLLGTLLYSVLICVRTLRPEITYTASPSGDKNHYWLWNVIGRSRKKRDRLLKNRWKAYETPRRMTHNRYIFHLVKRIYHVRNLEKNIKNLSNFVPRL